VSNTYWFVGIPFYLGYTLLTGGWPSVVVTIQLIIMTVILTAGIDGFLLGPKRIAKCSVCKKTIKLRQKTPITSFFCPTCKDTVEISTEENDLETT
jgi:hypothetical protein